MTAARAAENYGDEWDDDILTDFDNDQDSLNFLYFLNNKHPNIKVTVEKLTIH